MNDEHSFACRACMRVAMEFVHMECEIQEGCSYTLQDFFVSSTHLEVSKDDGLPHFLCSDCTDELRKFFEFVQKARESETAMRQKAVTLTVATTGPDAGKDDEMMTFTMEEHVVVDDEEPKFDELNTTGPGETTLEFNDQDDMNVIYTGESATDPEDDDMDDPGDIRLDDFSYKELAEPTGPASASRKYTCSQCGQQFPLKVALAKHLTESHSDKEFLCKLCGLPCRSRDMLMTHLFQHKDLKTYSCKHCDSQYFTKFGLRIHISQTHVNTNSCTVCEDSFPTKQELEDHQRLVHPTEEKNYPCHLCDKRFSMAVHLKHHILVHNGIQPYVRYNYRLGKKHRCHICSRVFTVPSDLRKHLLEHEGRYPYECPDCPRGFKRKHRFRDHLEGIHNKTLDINNKVIDLSVEENEQIDAAAAGIDSILK